MSQQSVDDTVSNGSQHRMTGASGLLFAAPTSGLPPPTSSVLPIPPTTRSEQSERTEERQAVAQESGPTGGLASPAIAGSTVIPTVPAPLPTFADIGRKVASVAAPDSDPLNPSNPSMHPTNDRQRVRHSFDVFADQILSLRDISLKRELQSGLHTRLGDLVQEALDQFITRETQRADGTRGKQRNRRNRQSRVIGRPALSVSATSNTSKRIMRRAKHLKRKAPAGRRRPNVRCIHPSMVRSFTYFTAVHHASPLVGSRVLSSYSPWQAQ